MLGLVAALRPAAPPAARLTPPLATHPRGLQQVARQTPGQPQVDQKHARKPPALERPLSGARPAARPRRPWAAALRRAGALRVGGHICYRDGPRGPRAARAPPHLQTIAARLCGGRGRRRFDSAPPARAGPAPGARGRARSHPTSTCPGRRRLRAADGERRAALIVPTAGPAAGVRGSLSALKLSLPASSGHRCAPEPLPFRGKPHRGRRARLAPAGAASARRARGAPRGLLFSAPPAAAARPLPRNPCRKLTISP